MREDVGYLNYRGKVARFLTARYSFDRDELCVEAEGPNCKLHPYGIPFPTSKSIGELPNRTYGPAGVHGDSIAESSIDWRDTTFVFVRVQVSCGTYDADANLITVSLEAKVRDPEFGGGGEVDCVLRCTVVDDLWRAPYAAASGGDR